MNTQWHLDIFSDHSGHCYIVVRFMCVLTEVASYLKGISKWKVPFRGEYVAGIFRALFVLNLTVFHDVFTYTVVYYIISACLDHG